MRPCGSVGFVGGRGFARGATLDAIARFLLPAVGRIVVNETRMSGTFSFDVEFVPAVEPAPPNAALPSAASVFTVLQEQLGLRLNAEDAPIDVLVIERVERPTQN